MDPIDSRPTAPFTIFHRTRTGEGGYACYACGTRRHGTFQRASDAFAVAAQHLSVCRTALRRRPLEGTAIIDGCTYGVVLREGVMILSVEPVFASGQSAVRLVV